MTSPCSQGQIALPKWGLTQGKQSLSFKCYPQPSEKGEKNEIAGVASPESELIPNPMRRKRKNENARVASPRNDTLNWNKCQMAVYRIANSVDIDQTAYKQSDQGLQCLFRHLRQLFVSV